MIKGFNGLIVVCILLLFGSSSAYSQQFKAQAFRVNESTLLSQLVLLKAANQSMSATDLAAASDALLTKTGLPFEIFFDAITCDNLKKARDAAKDPTAPLSLSTTLQSIDADRAGLILPFPKFMNQDCGSCGISLPILQITNTDFITLVQGRNIKFGLPSNFITDEIALVDSKDPTVVKRKWRIPFRAVPIGISYDETVLYLDFSQPELKDLSLFAFSEGVFQIGTRFEAENGGLGKPVGPQTDAAASGWKMIRFDRWSKSYVLKYRPRCSSS